MTWVKTDRAAKHLMVMLELPSCQSLSFREPDKWIRIAAAFSGFVTVWIPRFEARHGGRGALLDLPRRNPEPDLSF